MYCWCYTYLWSGARHVGTGRTQVEGASKADSFGNHEALCFRAWALQAPRTLIDSVDLAMRFESQLPSVSRSLVTLAGSFIALHHTIRSGIQAQARISQMNYFCTKKAKQKVLRKMRWNLEMCKKSEKMQKKVWQAVLVAGACLGWEYRKCTKKSGKKVKKKVKPRENT